MNTEIYLERKHPSLAFVAKQSVRHFIETELLDDELVNGCMQKLSSQQVVFGSRTLFKAIAEELE